jgi:threonine dehydratase
MAGLACGEVSELAWEILHGGTNVAVAVDDAYAAYRWAREHAVELGADPRRVADGTLGLSEFARRGGLAWAAITGRW